jgi:hypothetical protein
MKSKATLLTAILSLILATAASAEVLWDQSDYDPFGAAYFNSVSGSPPFGSTTYAVSDVTVDGGWHVESITTYFSALDVTWGTAIFEGHVHVFPKTAALPDAGDDPALSMVVPMSGVLVGDHWEVTASGLSIDLDTGEYWIGLTPVAPSGPFGPELHLGAIAAVGDATAAIDPAGFIYPATWSAPNPATDASILIEGARPVPVEDLGWGELKADYR